MEILADLESSSVREMHVNPSEYRILRSPFLWHDNSRRNFLTGSTIAQKNVEEIISREITMKQKKILRG